MVELWGVMSVLSKVAMKVGERAVTRAELTVETWEFESAD
jgi:hypothetical protein